MKTKSNIERILESGGFVVTSECGPPRGADPGGDPEERRVAEGDRRCGQCDGQSDLGGEDVLAVLMYYP